MKRCHACQKEIPADDFVGRQSQCPACGSDLHVCLNCAFYERGTYNDCREPQAERVLDKSRSNFCDYFVFRSAKTSSDTPQTEAKAKLEALFQK